MRKCPNCGTEFEGNFCPECGTMWQDVKTCPNCGKKIAENANFCNNCGFSFKGTANVAQSTTEIQSQNVTAQSPDVNNNQLTATAQEQVLADSKFTGGAFSNFFRNFAAKFVSGITLGLAYPAMKCWIMRWETEHTIIEGKHLKFDGTGGQLFGNYIKWLLLSIITLGLYYLFAMQTNIMKWQTKHTHFEGETGESEFTGSALGYLGVKIITLLVTIFTLFIGSFWATCYKNRWIASKKIIDGKQLYFDGKAMQYFGKRIVWLLLTIITIGIYSFWLKVKSKNWLVSHTKIAGVVGSTELQEFEKSHGIAAEQPVEPTKVDKPTKPTGLYLKIFKKFPRKRKTGITETDIKKKLQAKALSIASFIFLGIFVIIVVVMLIILWEDLSLYGYRRDIIEDWTYLTIFYSTLVLIPFIVLRIIIIARRKLTKQIYGVRKIKKDTPPTAVLEDIFEQQKVYLQDYNNYVTYKKEYKQYKKDLAACTKNKNYTSKAKTTPV